MLLCTHVCPFYYLHCYAFCLYIILLCVRVYKQNFITYSKKVAGASSSYTYILQDLLIGIYIDIIMSHLFHSLHFKNVFFWTFFLQKIERTKRFTYSISYIFLLISDHFIRVILCFLVCTVVISLFYQIFNNFFALD